MGHGLAWPGVNGLQHGGHATQAQLFQGTVEFNQIHVLAPWF